MDRIRPGTARRLLDLVEGCADLGVTWSLREVLLVRMTVNGETLKVIGVEPEGVCQVPWSIGGAKDRFRIFAETLAAGIPGAISYGTPRTWTVAKAGKKRLDILELLNAASALQEALAGLKSELEAALSSS